MKKILILTVFFILFIYDININVKGIRGRCYVEKYLNKFNMFIFYFAFIFVINKMDPIITLIVVGIMFIIAYIDNIRNYRLIIYNSESEEVKECLVRILDRKNIKFKEDDLGGIVVEEEKSNIEIEEDGLVTSNVKIKFSKNKKMKLIREELIENMKNVQEPICKYRNGNIFNIVGMSIGLGILCAMIIKSPYI